MLHKPILVSRLFGWLVLAACLAAGWPAAAEGEKDDSAAARRDEILDSADWKETMHAWNDWLAVQRIYDERQVKKLKRQLREKVEQMSPEELEEFHDDLRAKLHILMGAEARDARRWLSETLAVASEKYARKVRAEMPDVANLSAPELQAKLDRFEERLVQTRQGAAEARQAREERVRAVRAELRQQHDDSQRALDRAAQDMSAGARGGTFVPSAIHNRKSVADRGIWFGIGFW